MDIIKSILSMQYYCVCICLLLICASRHVAGSKHNNLHATMTLLVSLFSDCWKAHGQTHYHLQTVLGWIPSSHTPGLSPAHRGASSIPTQSHLHIFSPQTIPDSVQIPLHPGKVHQLMHRNSTMFNYNNSFHYYPKCMVT